MKTIKTIFARFFTSYNSIIFFFSFLFFISIFSILFFSPKFKKVEIEEKDIAKIDIRNFNIAEFRSDSLYTIIEGMGLLQYKDREELLNFTARRDVSKDDVEIIDYLTSIYGVKRGDLYEFPKGMSYVKSDNFSFFTTSGTYNMKDEIFLGQGEFFLHTDRLNATGYNINYKSKEEIIKADKINAKILLEGQKEGI